MFYIGGLPFHFARNLQYVKASIMVASNKLSGFLPIGQNALRNSLLQKERTNVEKLLQPIKGSKNFIDSKRKDEY